MSKVKTAFFCRNCGYESAKWLGKCPSCNEWNTFTEEIIQKENSKTSNNNNWDGYTEEKNGKTVLLKDIKSSEEKKLRKQSTRDADSAQL